MFKSKNGLHTYPKLAIYIIIVLSIMILTSAVIAGRISANAIKQETRKSNLVFLNKLSNIFENELAHINNVLVNYCHENLNYHYDGNIKIDEYDKHVLSKQIGDFIESNSFLYSVHIFLDHGENVFYQSDKQIGWKKTADFFDVGIYRNFIAANELSWIVESRTLIPDYKGNGSREVEQVVSIIKRIPANSLRSNNVVVFNIYSNYFEKLVGSSFIPDKSVIYIFDKKGDIFMSYNQKTHMPLDFSKNDMMSFKSATKNLNASGFSFSSYFNNKKCYYTALKSDLGMTYLLVIPEEIILKPASVVKDTLFVVAICLFVLGILFSALIDRKFFQPVLKILNSFSVEKTDSEVRIEKTDPGINNFIRENEFKQIESYINNILARNMEQEKRLLDYFSNYRERIIQKLMYGDRKTIEMLEDDKIFFSRNFVCFCIILLRYGYDDFNELQDDKAEYFGSLSDEFAIVLSSLGQIDKIGITQRKTALLLSMDCNRSSSEIKNHIIDNFSRDSENLNIAIGDIYGSMKNIDDSYSTAEKLLLCFKEECKILVIDEDMHAKTIVSDNIDNKELIEKVIGYIKAHYMKDISLNTIAEYVYFSPSYLGKIFKEVSGYSFTDYVIKVRMEAAARLILTNNIKLTEVMKKVGYYSIQGFSRVFKNYYSCSPGEYRKKAACLTLQPEKVAEIEI